MVAAIATATSPTITPIDRRPGLVGDGVGVSSSARSARTAVSDTADLLRAEQACGSDEEHDHHDDVGHDGVEVRAQEVDLVAVSPAQELGDADHETAHDRAPGGVKSTDDSR